jgi:hypothetical protein
VSLITDFKFALRSLARVKGLAITVVATLALGIGANAAIFSVVRGVLLRPLVNRDEDRLLYLRQSAPGIGVENATFSIPEIDDLGKGLKTAPTGALQDAENDDCTQAGSNAAQQGTDSKDGKAHHEEALAAHHVGEPPADGEDDCVRD